jgi:hypothetical protein
MRSPMEYERPLCQEVPWDLFYPEVPEKEMYSVYLDARKVCNLCEHRDECAEWGITYEIHGMWGGLTPVQREKIRSKRKVKRERPPAERELCLNLL